MPDGILTKFINAITEFFTGKTEQPAKTNRNGKASIFKGTKHTKNPHEISMMNDISDTQITRNNYISYRKNPKYVLKEGDTISVIAKKFGVEEQSILYANSLTKETAKNLKIGQILKIPPTKTVKNIRNLNDVAKSMGVSADFIAKLKKAEDSANLKPNQFHNTAYKDDAGVLTIGIGHVVKKGEPQKLSNAQVCSLLAKDLLKVEENIEGIIGPAKYKRLPQPMKEALLSLTFNKGTDILNKIPGLTYTLKVGKYEAAINKFSFNKSTTTGLEMSGLNKRRIFEISIACKMYKGKIPQSNINTAQQLYNRGIQLLRAECKKSGHSFENLLVGYNNDVKSYMGNRIKLITK